MMTTKELFRHFGHFFFSILAFDTSGNQVFARCCKSDKSDIAVIYAETLKQFGDCELVWWNYDFIDNEITLRIKTEELQG